MATTDRSDTVDWVVLDDGPCATVGVVLDWSGPGAGPELQLVPPHGWDTVRYRRVAIDTRNISGQPANVGIYRWVP